VDTCSSFNLILIVRNGGDALERGSHSLVIYNVDDSSRFFFRKNHNKRISILLALVLNILFLGIAFSFSYTEEMHIFGTGTEEISSLVIAIPLITWVNAFALQFIKPKQPDL